LKVLKDILYKVSIESVIGNTGRTIAALHYDSRNVGKNDVFIAIKGSAYDGHEFINTAISQGVSVVVCQELPFELVDSVTYVVVLSSSQALATMASNYYENPS
jgi:UDP-N-acetylmuramoyl-L-alanyl-D-glutamate--2,6-diaminopimelate ligase